MRIGLSLLLALVVVAAPVAVAQEALPERGFVVGAAPEYLVSVAVPEAGENGQALLPARLELRADCTWTVAGRMTVPADEVLEMRQVRDDEAPEQYGVYYAVLYSALVARAGGSPSVEYHGCIRRMFTDMAARQLQTRRQGQ